MTGFGECDGRPQGSPLRRDLGVRRKGITDCHTGDIGHWLAMTGFESAAGDRKGRPYGVTRGLCVRVVGDADPYGGRGGL